MKSFRDIPTSARGIPLFMRSPGKSKPAKSGPCKLRFVGQGLLQKLSSQSLTPVRTWTFSTQPRFERIVGKQEQNLLVERLEEPHTDVIDETKDIVIIMELPGVEEEDLEWEIEGDILWVFASTDKVKHYKEILLPFKVEPAKVFASFKNGILEIKCFRKGYKAVKRK